MDREQVVFDIRDARPDDVPALAALHVTTFKETHGVNGAPTYELREAQWRAAFAGESDWFCYVAELKDGRLVGFAKGTLHDGGVPGYGGELNKIYVLRAWHSQGIGRALVEGVARRFLAQGVGSMLLFGDARNPSNGFYERLGAERLLSAEGEFHGGYGWRDLGALSKAVTRAAQALAVIAALVLGVACHPALPPGSFQAATPSDGAYRWNVDYFNFRPDGTFLSKQRIGGIYRRRRDGTVEWSNVTVANAPTMEAAFPAGQEQAYMNQLRYRPNQDNLFAPEFFRNFPPTAVQAKNLVWDTFMFEMFGRERSHLSHTPYRLPASDVPLAGSGTFRNTGIELTLTGSDERDGKRLTAMHYEAFFNKLAVDVPGVRLIGRSDYWGDIWLSPAGEIDRATLFEEVVGEISLGSQSAPQIINVVRRGSFDRIGS